MSAGRSRLHAGDGGDATPMVRPMSPAPPRHGALASSALLVVGVCAAVVSWLASGGSPESRRPIRVPPAGRPPGAPAHAHETSDASARGVTAVAIGLLLGIGVSVLAVSWLMAHLTRQPISLAPPKTEVGVQAPPTPGNVPTLAELRRHEDQVLTSYAWIDRRAGVVRIPIERAIELLAARGLPARGAPAPERDVASASASGRFVRRHAWP